MGTFLLTCLALAACALIVGVVNGFVLPLKVHFRVSPASLPVDPARTEADPFVGLALSGGGARAAVFAAAGMKALHERGLLETVTHVSSVSGGGFPAAYLALNPVPQGGGSDAYFDQMQDVVAHDYFWDVQMQQMRKPRRAFSPSRRLLSLQEMMDTPAFLNGARFEDLPSSRSFFFNTVSYDTAQRVVLSNAVLPSPIAAKTASVLPARLRAQSFSDAEHLRAAPANMPLSLAVATSAAFPPYLGPTTLEMAHPDAAAPQYWHLGDGGVFENPGVETLREAIYARGTRQKATIYSFNAGMQLDPNLSQNTLDISIWSRDVTRLVDVLSSYATAHRETGYEVLDAQHDMQIEHIEFNYMDVARLVASGQIKDPKWQSWAGWNHATHADRTQSATPAAHLAKIPTALKITPGNRELIAAAAACLVAYHFPLGPVD